MCNSKATTREHAPPFCFFPKGYRENLLTVPSCQEHNNKNSKDVEYTRNTIISHFGNNYLAREHFQNKVLRSFKGSSRLLNRTFKEAIPIILNGEKTALNILDLPRYKLVMKSVAYAIYFKIFESSFDGGWYLFSPSLVSQEAFLHGKPDGSEHVRRIISKITFEEVEMPQPKIFRCGIHQFGDGNVAFEFVFYEGFKVQVLSVPRSVYIIHQAIRPGLAGL